MCTNKNDQNKNLYKNWKEDFLRTCLAQHKSSAVERADASLADKVKSSTDDFVITITKVKFRGLKFTRKAEAIVLIIQTLHHTLKLNRRRTLSYIFQAFVLTRGLSSLLIFECFLTKHISITWWRITWAS